MKKQLIILSLLLLGSFTIKAQSVKFSDLVYLTSLNNSGVLDNLMQGNKFKQDYSEVINGQEMEYFKNIGPNPNSERILTGSNTKMEDGTVLRTVEYTSTEVKNILAMVGQAKNYGLDLQFQGINETYNIYLYDNNFYMVNIYMRRDHTSGMVEIKQKEYLGLE